MAKSSYSALGDKGLEHRQPPQACIPTNARFLMFLHFGKNWGHMLSQSVIISGLLFLPCSQTHVRTSNSLHCIPLSTGVFLPYRSPTRTNHHPNGKNYHSCWIMGLQWLALSFLEIERVYFKSEEELDPSFNRPF